MVVSVLQAWGSAGRKASPTALSMVMVTASLGRRFPHWWQRHWGVIVEYPARQHGVLKVKTLSSYG